MAEERIGHAFKSNEAAKALDAPDKKAVDALKGIKFADPEYKKARMANTHIKDPLAPGMRFLLNYTHPMPVTIFVYRGNVWPDLLGGRLGKGPCKVVKTFKVPSGDYVAKGDTFDPVEERMSQGEFESLVARDYFTYDENDEKFKAVVSKYWQGLK